MTSLRAAAPLTIHADQGRQEWPAQSHKFRTRICAPALLRGFRLRRTFAFDVLPGHVEAELVRRHQTSRAASLAMLAGWTSWLSAAIASL